MDQPRSRRAAKPAEEPDTPAPAAPLDETDPESGDLPTRQVIGARSGEPLFSPEEAARFRAAAAEVSSLRSGPPMDRAGAMRPPVRTNNVYRARRPGVAILLMIPAAGASLLLVRALAIAAFGKVFSIAGVIASCLALSAVPLLVIGLYGLITGAAYAAEQLGFRTWARPPLAYLLVAFALLIASGLAIS
ncbi:MAG: hypothetical protein ACM30G_21110 [Micromonosporaceae bacterium]